MINLIAETAVRAWWMPEHTDAMFGAAVGGGIALVTAILTNRHARKRQRIELEHQATEREKERQHALKRETYIPIAEAATSATAFVAQISTVAAEQLGSMEPVMELGRRAAKCGLIAPPSVQEPLSRFHRQLGRISMELVLDRLAIEDVGADIASAGVIVQLKLNRQKELQLRIEKHTDAATGNQALIGAMVDEIRRAGDEVTQVLKDQRSLIAKKSGLELALQRRAVESLLPVSETGCELITAIRSDIGLPPNAEWLKKFSGEAVADVSASVKSFQDRFEKRSEEAREREKRSGGS